MSAKARSRNVSRATNAAREQSPSGWRHLRSDRLLWIGLAAAVLLFYAKPLFDSMASIQWDAADEMYPTQKYLSDSLHAGRVPFWTPYVFSGMPFLADPQVGAWYPLNWPFFLFGVTPRSLMWENALHAYLALMGGYLFGRDLLRGRTPALFVGVFFAFSGFFAGHGSHTGIFQGAALLPWLLWTGIRAARSSRWLPAVTVMAGLIVLAGHFQTALYAMFGLGCGILADFAVRGGSARGPLQALGCAAAGAVLLSSVMTLPGFELTAQSIRAGSDYRRDSGARLVPGALVTLVSPDHYGAVENQNYTGPPDVTQFFLYEGILLVPLALVGLAAARQRWYALALVVPSAWYAFGPPGGLYSVIAQLPGFRNVRAPIHIWFVAALGLALLAGAGVQILRDRFRSPWIPVALMLIVAGDVWYWNMDHNNLAYAHQSWAELYGGNQDRFRTVTEPLIADPLHRIWAPFDSPGFGPLDGTLNSGIEVTFGYNPLQLSRYTRYLSAAEQNPKLLNALGVTAKLNASNGTFAPNAAALPRVYAPQIVTPVRNPDEAAAHLASLDPAHESVAEAIAGSMPNNGSTQVHIIGYTGDSYRVRYQADHPTLFRVAVPYFPGWEAEADGQPARIVATDLALLGVLAPAGNHELVLRYRSTWFRAGAAISLLSWLAVLGWLYLERRKPFSEATRT